MNFYKRYLGDYARDTAHLSLLEHGVYAVLLDVYYATERPLPADRSKLYRIARAFTSSERKAVDKIAEQFFPPNGDGSLHNKRADKEIAKRGDQVDHNRTVGKLGGRPPKKKPGDNPDGFTGHNPDETRQEPGDNPSHSQKPDKTTTSAAPAAEARGDAASIPDCPHDRVIALYHEVLPQCPRVEKWTPARQQALRTRWRDEARPNREKHRGYKTTEEGLAYWRRFFIFVSTSKFLTGLALGRDGKPPFLASLAWLVKAENFAKVIEGNYHRDKQ